MIPALHDIAAREYVLLTTFRRTGVPVATPVWIVRDGEDALITTAATSGKVKRLAHTARVVLTPCDMRGRLLDGAEAVEATAVVRHDEDTRARIDRALMRKYGVKYTAIRAGQKLMRSKSVSVTLVLN
ncbi:PPOX class F420-dependent oxidoreductase [Microbacterium sp. zg.B48]|uniref:PPOX class F420-dependent oxidoreductase n=1 Tax=Microbacterium sp. zg.B48 TaxID=2969408 RepID=UPI00214B7B10|nr:PPOX class F420-dependent oxidoreductase [Microbacterium sp. zg.B48]MCR2763786.1 PPOX class F420-dependent oxidoreductase [Microbacterium sp. zg.B48]